LGSIGDANVQVNNTSFAGVETLGGGTKIHVLSSLVSSTVQMNYDIVRASEVKINYGGPNEGPLTTLVGFINVGDAEYGDHSQASTIAATLNRIIDSATFVNARLFAAVDNGMEFENNPRAWYWADTGDGIAQAGELTAIAILTGQPSPENTFIAINV
jgi:hypothetical protein